MIEKVYKKVKNRIYYEKYLIDLKIKEKKSYIKEIKEANAKTYLKIRTYDTEDGYQAIHPSIIDFKNKWNGWRYWLGYTPYTYSNEDVENPCIAVSNDLINWYEPKGLINPIDNTPTSNEYHLSDIHLVYIKEKDIIECWYRKRTRNPIDSEEILRKISNDGINWSDSEVLYKSKNTFNKFLSPVINYDEKEKLYQIWVVEESHPDNIVKYFESEKGNDWKFIRNIKLPKYEEFKIWHMDIHKTQKGYEMYYCGLRRDGWLFYSSSSDNIQYEFPTVVMQPSRKRKAFDNKGLYRPCFFINDNKYYIIYSALDKKGKWATGISVANVDNPTNLKGIDS